jgi:hypothetical protein
VPRGQRDGSLRPYSEDLAETLIPNDGLTVAFVTSAWLCIPWVSKRLNIALFKGSRS